MNPYRTESWLALAGIALLGLASPPPADADPPDFVDSGYLFIATSDYSTTAGAFTLMDPESPWPRADNYGILSGDAIPHAYNGKIWILDRANGSLQVIDPQQDFGVTDEFSVGVDSNPQDIAFVSPARAFVTRYESTELWEIDPRTGLQTDAIDLALFADTDGLPEMHQMAVYGGFLFVTLQRLDRDAYWEPVPPSYLAVIDLATNELHDVDPITPGIQAIELAATNPNSGIVVDPQTGDFLIGEAGSYGAADGGVERFDPQTLTSAGMVVTEEELGGNLDFWTTDDGLHGYGLVLGSMWETEVREFDLQTGAIVGTPAASPAYAYSHFLIDCPRDQLFVSDRTYENPGVRVFGLSTYGELTSGPIDVGLYPYWLLAMPGTEADIADRLAPDALGLDAYPQPAPGHVRLRFDPAAAGTGPVDIVIFDAGGRRVAAHTWLAGSGSGVPDWLWDGRDPAGRRLASGSYWARLRTPRGTATRRLELVR